MKNEPISFKCMCGLKLTRKLPARCPACRCHVKYVAGSNAILHMQFTPHHTEMGQAIVKAADSCVTGLKALNKAVKERVNA